MKAVIFDLDGVIVTTDKYHYQAWKEICVQEGIPFNEEINKRLRGVSRMDCVDILLGYIDKSYTTEEKRNIAKRKNNIYVSEIEKLKPSDILPGVKLLLQDLKELGIKLAIGSSSKNAELILRKIGLIHLFDTIVSGNDIKDSKPNPEIFLLAAKKLNMEPEHCIVMEDAIAGVEAGMRAGMKVIGIGENLGNVKVIKRVNELTEISVVELLNL